MEVLFWEQNITLSVCSLKMYVMMALLGSFPIIGFYIILAAGFFFCYLQRAHCVRLILYQSWWFRCTNPKTPPNRTFLWQVRPVISKINTLGCTFWQVTGLNGSTTNRVCGGRELCVLQPIFAGYSHETDRRCTASAEEAAPASFSIAIGNKAVGFST